LNDFPVAPRVLDEWEMENIFDCEFKVVSGQGSSRRREAVRLDHEALWSTGAWMPPGLPVPEPLVSQQERDSFEAYYRSRSTLYCYVLPSDITRKCLEYLQAMPVETELPIPLDHLIVDEYQDLNPVDLELIREIQQRGVRLFACGDDDQSIYIFRYASPAGIQKFEEHYPGAAMFDLEHCFRCPQEILDPALTLLAAHAPDTRIPKTYTATPSLADPRVVGRIERWYFRGQRREADAIASSCRLLTDSGVPASEIAVLLSARRPMQQTIIESLQTAEVAFEVGDEPRFVDELPGRAAFALLRLAAEPDDYAAIRTLIGLPSGVGGKTCNGLASWVISSGLRYRDILTWPNLDGLDTRARGAILATREAIEFIEDVAPDGMLTEALDGVTSAIDRVLDEAAGAAWRDYAAGLPDGITVEEACRLLASPTPRATRAVMLDVKTRLGLPTDDDDQLAVRVMTLHGSKGLTFDVVFIPGLEQGFLPSEHDLPYSGLVQQAARLLYVGITRARLMAVLSLAAYRMIQGDNIKRQPTPFIGNLSGRFEAREEGLNADEADSTIVAREAMLLKD
jgi:DNA helicase-2/ATP-dependent DNA helicase PcrA